MNFRGTLVVHFVFHLFCVIIICSSKSLGMKRILVTGANKGIGIEIVRKLLSDHGETFVLLGSRDPARGNAALENLILENPEWRARAQVVTIDTSSQESVQSAMEQVKSVFQSESHPLYGVINNAGIGFGFSLKTILSTNLYGVKSVCDSFLPLLLPDQGRIVNVGSGAGPMFVQKCTEVRKAEFTNPEITWDELDSIIREYVKIEELGGAAALESEGYGTGEAYPFSKACLHALTQITARENPNLRINCCSPGFINTDLVKDMARKQGRDPADMGAKEPAAGAIAPVYLMMGDVEGQGWYYGSDGIRSPLDRYRAPGEPAFTGS